MAIVHTKIQHGSDIYMMLGLHWRHGSVHDFATGFRVHDKESTQRSFTELNRIHEGWGMAKRLRLRMEEWPNGQPSCEGFLPCARVSKYRCRGKTGSDRASQRTQAEDDKMTEPHTPPPTADFCSFLTTCAWVDTCHPWSCMHSISMLSSLET